MSLHCIGRRNVRSVVWYALGGAGSRIYGQIPEIAILPVTGGCVLRADPRNRRFARKPVLDID